MEDESVAAVTASGASFANRLFQILAKTKGNVFFSPISIHAILSLLYQGASDETADCFKNALNIPSAKTAADGYKKIMSALNSAEQVTLHMANKVFVQQGYKLKDAFKSTATDYFSAEAENIDFGDSTGSAGKINGWVEKKTRHKIKDIIKAEDVDAATCMVLINAVYFKGTWFKQFDPKHTTTEPFYVSDGKTVDCRMMHMTKNLHHTENYDLDAQILAMPYKNTNVSLVIVLPNSRDGIEEMESKLADFDLTSLSPSQDYADTIELSLPKFKIEETVHLKEPLSQVGLARIFSDNAEFDKMLDTSQPVRTSKVIQKAFIEVDEIGTEAAAATRGEEMFMCAPPVMTVDHPFIFFLQSKSADGVQILFLGRVSQPTPASSYSLKNRLLTQKCEVI